MWPQRGCFRLGQCRLGAGGPFLLKLGSGGTDCEAAEQSGLVANRQRWRSLAMGECGPYIELESDGSHVRPD